MLRSTFKSLLSRKARLLLSSIAVTLGVTFIVGTLVLNASLGKSFEQLFSTAYEGVDVVVLDEGSDEMSGRITSDVVDDVAAVDGVEKVDGVVAGQVNVVGQNGKVLPPSTFTIGQSWLGEEDPYVMREGEEPKADDEVVLSATLVDAAGYTVGDEIPLLSPAAPEEKMFKIVGVFGYTGDRDTLFGEGTVAFTEPAAQEFLLGEAGVYTSVQATGGSGTDAEQLSDDVASALGGGYDVKTGEEMAEETAGFFRAVLDIFQYVLLGFGAVALLVSIFLIINTFSIIVAQRTRELALFRAMGASRGQVFGSVMLEALFVGLIAGVMGFGLGVAVGYGGAAYLGNRGVELDTTLVIPWTAYLTALIVGVGVTMVAALLPARRAGRIPPIAALREAANTERPVKSFGIAGGATLAIGGGLLAAALAGAFGEPTDNSTLWGGFGGILLLFVGAAVFVPVVARPAVSAIGRLVSWSLPGKLGRRNSARNPRRTAITAATLMIGVTLVTAVGVLLSSLQSSVEKFFDENVSADMVVQGTQTGPVPPTFDESIIDDTAALDGVDSAVGIWAEQQAEVDGQVKYVQAVHDLPALTDLMGMTAESGDLDEIGPDEIVVSKGVSEDEGTKVGDTVEVVLPGAESPQEFTVSAVAKFGGMQGGYVISADNADQFTATGPVAGYVKLDKGADEGAVEDAVAGFLADNPVVTVSDTGALVDQQTESFDILLIIVQILLGLAMLIAVIGVVNTLTLSVLERTRELGLLRAVGLTRRKVSRMVTVESIVIALFGALLGLAVGAGLGVAVRELLADDFLTELDFPWGTMVFYLVAAVVIGYLSALIPAFRA
ncbi:MAG: ABC transporter permease, partial [Stackebrandtia sp.]